MKIKGLEKNTLIDYPGKIACTIFVSGCNFRCPFCQNPELVLDSRDLKEYSEKEIMDFLQERKEFLEGVCITGGEPLIYPEIREFLRKIKKIGYGVKVDTNGSNPNLLQELIDGGLVDYVAMDIKASLKNYGKSSGVKTDKEKIKESIEIVKKLVKKDKGEFRITVVPGLHDEQEIRSMADVLEGGKVFLQQFRNEKCLDRSFEKTEPFSREKLEEFCNIIREKAECSVR